MKVRAAMAPAAKVVLMPHCDRSRHGAGGGKAQCAMQIALAPMEGLVDDVLRDVLTRVGGIDWCVTEFIRVNDQLLPAHVFHRHAPELATGAKTRSGTPRSEEHTSELQSRFG